MVGGPALVHVDAYRLHGALELDDLDLDASLDEAVTVVEWGTGVAEDLADDRLEVEILRTHGDTDDDPSGCTAPAWRPPPHVDVPVPAPRRLVAPCPP